MGRLQLQQKINHRINERRRYNYLMQRLNNICKVVPGQKNGKKAEKLRDILMYTRYLHYYYYCILKGKSTKRFTPFEFFLFYEKAASKVIEGKKRANVVFLGDNLFKPKSLTTHAINKRNLSSSCESVSTTTSAEMVSVGGKLTANVKSENYSIKNDNYCGNSIKGRSEDHFVVGNYSPLSQKISTKLVYNFGSHKFNEIKMCDFQDALYEEGTSSAHAVGLQHGGDSHPINVYSSNTDVCGITPSCFVANKMYKNDLCNTDDDEYVRIEFEDFPSQRMNEQSLRQTVASVKNSLETSPVSLLKIKSEELDWDSVTFHNVDFEAVDMSSNEKFCAVCNCGTNLPKNFYNSQHKLNGKNLCDSCYKNKFIKSLDVEELMQMCNL